MRRAVFLDRDGVLNRLVARNGQSVSPRRLAEFALLPGVRPAVAALRRASLLVIVVTNQPDVARGALTPAELERMHDRLLKTVPIDAIYACPHDEPDSCACRKPNPGLLRRASLDWNIHLETSFLVGDTWKDIAAGKAAGCATIQVGATLGAPVGVAADFMVPDLPAAAEIILGELERRRETLAGRQGPAPKPKGTAAALARGADSAIEL